MGGFFSGVLQWSRQKVISVHLLGTLKFRPVRRYEDGTVSYIEQ